jgi:hypothetical protein
MLNIKGNQMKVCFKCQRELPLSDFYKHPQMGDGYLNKCKECTKKDVKKHREDNINYYREYDRNRGNRQTKEYIDSYRENHPLAYKAKTMVSNAVRDGRLFKEPCESCGSDSNIHGHHDDYAKPLNVRWLCAACHSQWHKKHGHGKNF